MGGITFGPSSVDLFGTLKYYHLDEPIEKGAYPESVRWIAQYIHNYYPNSIMMMSSYRGPTTITCYPNLRCGTYAHFYRDEIMNNASNTRIMCDEYSIDQRSLWTEFKNSYTNKNFANWLSLDKDHDNSQYYDLLGHANNKGINNLWVYGYGSGNGNYIDDFCDAAWAKGWLRKFQMEWAVTYRCNKPNCECDPDYWVIISSLPTGNKREVFPLND